MHKKIEAFGYDIDFWYRVSDDMEVFIDKTSVKGAGNISALEGMDVVSVCRENIEKELFDSLGEEDGD